MLVSPKVRGFICTTAHPEGCAENVREQINYVKSRKKINGAKRVLVIGGSTGYGLATRIAATFGMGASTVGVFFEKPAKGGRTASAGWYNTAEFERAACAEGYYSKSINGDAFSEDIKKKTIEVIKEDLGKVDLVVYSLAAPRRIHPVTGETFSSVIKPIGKAYSNKTVDFQTGEVTDVTIEPAAEDEIKGTVAVMGGEDWELWIRALKDAKVLSEGAVTIAYSYIGPEITHYIYREGTIGRAKDHLEASAQRIAAEIKDIGGNAYVSVNKALVTQSSSAIPVVPLYISILYKIMKEEGIHEGCIEQVYRLFLEELYSGNLKLDEAGRIRVDDLEMRQDVQEKVLQQWNKINSDNIEKLSDIEGYREDFFRLFGFGIKGIDYSVETNVEVQIPSVEID